VNKIYYKTIGKSDKLRIFWLHGWGHSHKELTLLSEFFHDKAENILFDLPGFGQSQEPEKVWDSPRYAKEISNLIQKDFPKKAKKTIVIGHSFGGKLSLLLAANNPKIFDGLVLLASAGFKKRRTLKKLIKIYLIKFINKSLFFLPEKTKNKIRGYWGSEDYKKATPIMREILKKSITEDLSNKAKQVKQPTLIIYGENDKATPKEFGRKFNQLIKNSKLEILENQTHNSILFSSKYVVQSKINTFIKEIK
jgi:pimeloyl-ACP methyl ester carboxylesterase